MRTKSNTKTQYKRTCPKCHIVFLALSNTRLKCPDCCKCEQCGAQLAVSLRRFCSLACSSKSQEGILRPKAVPSLRDIAKAAGLKRYFTGIPCKHGHIVDRFVSSTACTACVRLVTARHVAIHGTSSQKYPERDRARNKKWKKANPDKLRVLNARYQQKHKNDSIKAKNERRKLNPEMLRKHEHAYRARKVSAEGTHTADDIKRIWKTQGYKCAVPGCTYPISSRGKTAYNVDHIIALARGGTNWHSNLQCLCRNHNAQKHAKDPYEWAQTLDIAQRLLFLK